MQDASVSAKIGDDEKGWGIRTNLQQFFQYIEELNLVVTSRHYAFWQLQEDLKGLESSPDDALLTLAQSRSISEHVSPLRATLDAELAGVSAYTLTPKRYDVSLFIDNISAVFSPGVYDKLPTIAQYDLREAGKCLAFERCTASAFIF